MKALITGGTSGIGLAMAKELLKKNYEVILISRKEGDLDELKNKDFGSYVAVKLFKDSFRLHCDVLKRMNVNSNLLNDNSGKYFLTLNRVIPQEIAKAMFDIEIEGDSVNYVNKQPNQIIECSSSNYKSIKEYDDSN